MKRGVRKRAGENLSPANIRRVIHSLNEEGITKKVACEMLNISYNTTRLSNIINDYEDTKRHRRKMMDKNRGKPASKDELKEMIEMYLDGQTVTKIYFLFQLF